jgi:hypothetical protein
MSNEIGSRVRYGEAFWRGHHVAWQQSELNQREYCEAHGIPLGSWQKRTTGSGYSQQLLLHFGKQPRPAGATTDGTISGAFLFQIFEDVRRGHRRSRR